MSEKKPSLTSLSRASGWAAKLGPETLAQVLCRLPKNQDPNLLSADLPFADAAIYRIDECTALVQSVDFFTPVVDDPYLFGQIAAANSLSDVYATGGRPLTAMNVVAFPTCALGNEVLSEILRGGAEKVIEAGAVIAGGHSIEDAEPKYGLAVTGIVDPRAMITAAGCRPGDLLYLTKPLGTGILTTALKGEVVTEEEIAEALRGMAALNRRASEVMMTLGVSAATDITGFGLAGHALELAQASAVGLEIQGATLPAYPRALEMASMGLIPEGSYRNRAYYLPRVEGAQQLGGPGLDLLFDPQTSGGLLIAVPPSKAGPLERQLRDAGCFCWHIGEARSESQGVLKLI